MAARKVNTTKVGPYSKPGRLAKVDGRRREAIRLRNIRAELVRHVGGSPSVAERHLIERTALLILRMELMDRGVLADGVVTDHDATQYICWHNAVRRSLIAIGLKATPEHKPSLADFIATGTTRAQAAE